MKIEYSKEADAIYVYFKEAYVAKSKEIEDGVVIDFDEKGLLIGIEVLDVSQRFSLSDIVNVSIENLPVEAENMKVLIVEDNADYKRLLKLILGDHGYKVIEAADSREAFDMALEHRPELILVEVKTPTIDALELLRRMKNEQTKDIPVIALTSFDTKEDRERFLDKGFDDYISKPFDADKINELVKKYARK